MPANVEIKARVRDVAGLERRLALLVEGPPEVIRQEDTFFDVPRGRLKLRVLAPGRGELIEYQRPDSAGPALSTYTIVPTDDPEALRARIAADLGVRGVVRKVRRLYHVDQTRVHLDEVEGLGSFIELEVVLADGQSEEDGAKIAGDLARQLGISRADLVEGAYIDLLARR